MKLSYYENDGDTIGEWLRKKFDIKNYDNLESM